MGMDILPLIKWERSNKSIQMFKRILRAAVCENNAETVLFLQCSQPNLVLDDLPHKWLKKLKKLLSAPFHEQAVVLQDAIRSYKTQETWVMLMSWLFSPNVRMQQTSGNFFEHMRWSSLDYACKFGDTKLVEAILMGMGKRSRLMQHQGGTTSLHIAASHGNADTMKLLLNGMTALDLRNCRNNDNSMTLLMYAAMFGNTETFDVLLDVTPTKQCLVLDRKSFSVVDYIISRSKNVEHRADEVSKIVKKCGKWPKVQDDSIPFITDMIIESSVYQFAKNIAIINCEMESDGDDNDNDKDYDLVANEHVFLYFPETISQELILWTSIESI